MRRYRAIVHMPEVQRSVVSALDVQHWVRQKFVSKYLLLIPMGLDLHIKAVIFPDFFPRKLWVNVFFLQILQYAWASIKELHWSGCLQLIGSRSCVFVGPSFQPCCLIIQISNYIWNINIAQVFRDETPGIPIKQGLEWKYFYPACKSTWNSYSLNPLSRYLSIVEPGVVAHTLVAHQNFMLCVLQFDTWSQLGRIKMKVATVNARRLWNQHAIKRSQNWGNFRLQDVEWHLKIKIKMASLAYFPKKNCVHMLHLAPSHVY